MSVTIREAVDADAWDSSLGTLPNGSFYHLYGWRHIVHRQFNHLTDYRVAINDGHIIGLMPLVLVASPWFGRILCSVPFMNYGGPCAASPAIAGVLATDAMSRASQLGADYLELRCAERLQTAMQVSTRKVSMTLALDADPDKLWNSYTSKHRKNVRRAYKNGLAVVSGGVELLDDFYRVLERSWRDLGTPFYRRDYFQAILETFPAATRVYLCRHGSRAVSVAMVGFHGGTAEGLWQGGLPEARALDANYALYWDMIRDICQRGYREFHLGRSTADSGSEWFKSRWNAETRQLYWYFHRPDGGPLPALNVDNPRFRLAIAVWRRLPLWLVRRIGPPLARGIP